MKNILVLLVGFLLLPIFAFAQESEGSSTATLAQFNAYMFVREDCSHCQDLKEFIAENNIEHENYTIEYLDIYTDAGRDLFNEATSKLGTGKVTPIAFVDGEVFVGFSEDVLGKALLEDSKTETEDRSVYPYASYLEINLTDTNSGASTDCDAFDSGTCREKGTLTIPVLGEINPQTASLSFIAVTLGFVDGFNPCAMWVLLTFLLILSQVGNKKKMIQIAGLFIISEAFMYYLILNVWYQTWDFIALDGIVTPLVGLLGLGSGIFFLYKYRSSKDKPLTCDVTSIEHQQKTETKIQKLISKPLTFTVGLAIIGLALSVNIIEFACSIGIPQAFTKILELNNLSFVQYQGYTLLYTLFYMADDFIVFGLAIWGYQKFYSVGHKYSRYSTLVAGILMVILGAILLLNPDILSY